MVLEMNIIKEELRFEENLKKRLEFICEFSMVTPTFVNGSIRKIEKTNISYIEPHRVLEDLRNRGKEWRKEYNNFPMRPLGWLNPREFIKKYKSQEESLFAI